MLKIGHLYFAAGCLSFGLGYLFFVVTDDGTPTIDQMKPKVGTDEQKRMNEQFMHILKSAANLDKNGETMEEIIQDNLKNIPKSLLKRNTERQQQSEKRKEEKLEIGSSQQQVNYFLDAFGKKHTEVVDTLDAIENESIAQNELADCFNRLTRDLQTLNRFLSTSTVYLRVYDIRKCKQLLEETQIRCHEAEEKFLPKKKFGFKVRKRNTQKEKKTEGEEHVMKADVTDGEGEKSKCWWKEKDGFCGFSGKRCEVLRLDAGQVEGKDVELTDVHNCTVIIFGAPSTLHITGISRCKVLSGPVATSIFVENCEDSTLVFACQQLRIHSTQNSRFYIHVTSRAIIEDSTTLKFAPFSWHYDGIEEHFKHAQLDCERNNWNQVDDFNWLVVDTPSPNWSIIEETERIDWKSSFKELFN